jgi:catechol 2,3-dioxygenase-like lactoylglutathione lyase family enzyme
MIVKRIVTNFVATDVSKARHFYTDILGLEVVMKRRNRRRFGDASAGHLDRGE